VDGVVVLRWWDRQRRAWDVMFNPTVGEGGSRRYVSVLLAARDEAALTPSVVHAFADDLSTLIDEDARTRTRILREDVPRWMAGQRVRPGPTPKRSPEVIAQVYQAALDEGKPPVMAVARHFGIARQQASREVKRARDRGALPKGRG